ncbi:MAG: hypothetical protein IPN36_03455 [Bacteroidetes bacterium]|nr:hypothetical protein [Bacteroidota bacterium]
MMKWTYSIKNKITAAGLLFLVLGLVIFSNYNERNKSAEINSTISSMYKDRLIVESYIFMYSQKFQQIIELIDNEEVELSRQQSGINQLLTEAKALNLSYEQTKLTDQEALNFYEFVALCEDIQLQTNSGNLLLAKQSAKEASGILQVLSSIQVTEARMQMSSIDKLFNMTSIYSQFELVILVIIGLIIQGLIFASGTLRVKPMNTQANLN